MLIRALPDTLTKLTQVGDATIYEPAGDQPLNERRRVPYQSQSLAECITNVSTPKGQLPIVPKNLVFDDTGFMEPTFGLGSFKQQFDR